VIILLSI